MQRREFIMLLGGAAATWPLVARAQQPAKIPTVGALWHATRAEPRDKSRKYIGPVSTRVWAPDQYAAAPGTYDCQTYHYARDDFSWVRILWPNFYAGTERGSGGTTTLNIGVFDKDPNTNACIGRVTGVTVASGTLGSVDIQLSRAVARNSKFWLRYHVTNSVGLVYTCPNNTLPVKDAMAGDAITAAGSADLTAGNVTITDSGSYAWIGPLAILAPTRKATFGIYGDSRSAGWCDTNDSSGDLGKCARTIGPTNAYVNVSIGGETAENFTTYHTQRVKALQYCSHIIAALGAHSTSAMATCATILAPKPHIVTTFEPITTSTDGWTTVANQTPFSLESIRLSLNAFARSVPACFVQCWDAELPIESSLNSGKWICPGGTATTADGTHENQAGYLMIAAAKLFDPTAWHVSDAMLSNLTKW